MSVEHFSRFSENLFILIHIKSHFFTTIPVFSPQFLKRTCNMSTDNTTSLIVVLRNTSDVEKDGRIIRFGNGANLDTIRSLAAEKLAITGGYANIQLFNSNGELLGGIDDLRQQQVVYVDIKELIRETVPGPTKLPFVGSLYEMLPNM